MFLLLCVLLLQCVFVNLRDYLFLGGFVGFFKDPAQGLDLIGENPTVSQFLQCAGK